MYTRKLFPALAICALAGLIFVGAAGCGSSGDNSGSTASTETVASPPASGNAARSEKVEIVDFAYDPDPVTIEEGGKVIWKNEDSVAHTATAEDGSFDTGTIEEGKLKSETFKQPGVYKYFCSIHPQMHGTVEVVPAS
jgi:plastocyanin